MDLRAHGSVGSYGKKSQVTPPGIDPETLRLVGQRLNHYATPGPIVVVVVVVVVVIVVVVEVVVAVVVVVVFRLSQLIKLITQMLRSEM